MWGKWGKTLSHNLKKKKHSEKKRCLFSWTLSCVLHETIQSTRLLNHPGRVGPGQRRDSRSINRTTCRTKHTRVDCGLTPLPIQPETLKRNYAYQKSDKKKRKKRSKTNVSLNCTSSFRLTFCKRDVWGIWLHFYRSQTIKKRKKVQVVQKTEGGNLVANPSHKVSFFFIYREDTDSTNLFY